MIDQPGMIPYWQSLLQSLNDQPAPDFRLAPSQRVMVESFLRATMERRLAHHIAPTQNPRCVIARFTLKQTRLPTPRDTASPSRVLRYMRLTAPATLARVYSLMRELQPLFSLESIETIPDSYSYQR